MKVVMIMLLSVCARHQQPLCAADRTVLSQRTYSTGPMDCSITERALHCLSLYRLCCC